MAHHSAGLPGDWPCASCAAHNFARNSQCFRCGRARGATAAPVPAGDWDCPSCRISNFARRSDCFKCRRARPAAPRPPPERKQGDWDCDGCGVLNFARNATCFRCRQRKAVTQVTKEGDKCCAVCLVDKADMLVLPCRHVATCATCTAQLSKCPMCNAALASAERVFV